MVTPADVAAVLEAARPGSTIHLVGAGGCGMSGLGHLFLDLGYRVTGSDLATNDFTRGLQARGAVLARGHDARHLAGERPVLVVHSPAVALDNPELMEAARQRAPVVCRAVVLAALMHRQRGVAVAGMHGKTTTTALLAFVLETLSANPSFAVGAHVPQLSRHARFSPEAGQADPDRTPLFVVEADESDGTLSSLHPAHAIVLNVDEEHLDHFSGLDAVCREFDAFGRNTAGHLVYYADDPRLESLYAGRPGAVSYGFDARATYRLTTPRVDTGGRHSFEVRRDGAVLGEFTLRLPGAMNVSNAGAVIALLHCLGYKPGDIAPALGTFRGTARRQEELFADARFRVFDDYGHHPAEIEATLSALRPPRPGRLLVAFQPHRYTRTHKLMDRFARAFGEADRLWLTEIYAASEPPMPGVTGERLAETVSALTNDPATGHPARPAEVTYVRDLADLRQAVRAAMVPGDVVLFLGAGDITRAAHELAADLREETVTPNETLRAGLAATLSPGAVVKADEPLAKRTTLRVGGRADLYVEPASEADLAATLQFCRKHGLKFTLLGRGSNLLIRDGGVRGAVICLCHPHFSRLEVMGARLECGAGVKLKQIAVEARRAGLTGLEFLEGIPGSLGGSMRMNAGAMGSWLFEVIERIRFMDQEGGVHERPAAEVEVHYRGCPLFKTHIALGAVLKGQPATPEAVAARMAQFSGKRWESQPAAPSAGCIFKNPTTVPAGKLIDELGLKGTRVGGAVVSDVHGNFIVNDGNATAADVLGLIEVIRQRARAARGIELETEVEILGEG